MTVRFEAIAAGVAQQCERVQPVLRPLIKLDHTMSRHIACILLCLTALRSAAAADEDPMADLKKGMPKDVAALIDRIVECNHWRGEEPYDAERKKEISSALTNLKCNRLTFDESKTLKKNASNSKVLNALKKAKETSY